MGKICDPPSFTGGQCFTSYSLPFRATRIGQGTVFVLLAFDYIRNTTLFRGPIQEIGIPYDNGFGWNFLVTTRDGTFEAQTRFASPSNNPNTNLSRWSQPVLQPLNGSPNNCGDPPPTNCRCTPDSCRVDCATAPNGFCCIDHAVTNRLLQTLQG